MQYTPFKKAFKDFVIFTQQDIKIFDRSFCRQNLHEWQKKGYIKKVVKGYYVFSELEITDSILFTIANEIYKPSYISFESALSYYHFIPEIIHGITSVNSKDTYKFKTYLGNFIYKKIKPELMFGYKLVKYSNHVFKIAEAEKAILDFFYIKPHLKDSEDFEELRIDRESFFEKVNLKKLKKYTEAFKNKRLAKRMKKLVRYLKNA